MSKRSVNPTIDITAARQVRGFDFPFEVAYAILKAGGKTCRRRRDFGIVGFGKNLAQRHQRNSMLQPNHTHMKIETTHYTCDLTGKPCAPMSETEHAATLRFDFGYGSRLDGAHGEFHLSASAAEEVWALLQSRFPQLRLRGTDDLPTDR